MISKNYSDKILRKVILFALVLAVTGFVEAQEKPGFHQIDSLSLNAYLAGDWPEVIRTGKEGLRNETDYYYLRMRIGIAFYSLNKYDQAAIHFKKALEFNHGDAVAQEYLYYAYLFSGRDGEATEVLSEMNEPLKKNLRKGRKPYTLFTEGGFMMAPEADSLMAYNPGGARNHNYQVSGYSFGSLGLTGKTGNNLTLTLGFQRLNFTIQEQYQLPSLDPFVFDVSFAENSFYSGARWNLKSGFTLLGGFRHLAGNYTWHEYNASQGGGEFTEKNGRYRDLAFHTSINKRLPFLNLGLSADLNRFKGNLFYQTGAGITLYPQGNLNLYLTGEISRTGIDSTWISSGTYIWKGILGIKVAPKVWVEATYTKGLIQNWSESQAYIVYNNFDPALQRFGINLLSVNLLKNLDISLRYNWTERLASWEVIEGNGSKLIDSQVYSFHSIILGGTWRF